MYPFFLFCLCVSIQCAFNLSYVGFVPTVTLRQATDRAMAIMDAYLITRNPIDVHLYYTDNEPRDNIARSAITHVYSHPQDPQILIPIALQAQLSDHVPPAGPYLVVSVNADGPYPLYFGVDGKPPDGSIDYITLLLHELMHGLGFATGFSDAQYYDLISETFIYDYFVWKDSGVFPHATHYPLYNSTILTSGPLFFHGVDGAFLLYTPSAFRAGSSVLHAASSASLMFYKSIPGKAMHCLTEDCVNFLKTVGYTVNQTTSCCVSAATSMELTASLYFFVFSPFFIWLHFIFNG